MLDQSARSNAQAQWTTNPCGGDVADGGSRMSYFKRVEIERYRLETWMHDLFGYWRYGGQRVLEIGVGLGTDLIQFADAGADCHAIDITDEHMNLARENFALRGYPVEIRYSDATDIQHPSDSFDVVYSLGVVHHIPEIDKVLAEVHRVLKPGGKALIGVYYKWSVVHLVNMLLISGIRHGRLFKLGYRRLLSTIETGADGEIIAPYVRLYSGKDLAGVMREAGFETTTLHVRDCQPFHAGSLLGAVLPAGLFKALDRRMGWYLIAEATKAGPAEGRAAGAGDGTASQA